MFACKRLKLGIHLVDSADVNLPLLLFYRSLASNIQAQAHDFPFVSLSYLFRRRPPHLLRPPPPPPYAPIHGHQKSCRKPPRSSPDCPAPLSPLPPLTFFHRGPSHDDGVCFSFASGGRPGDFFVPLFFFSLIVPGTNVSPPP